MLVCNLDMAANSSTEPYLHRSFSLIQSLYHFFLFHQPLSTNLKNTFFSFLHILIIISLKSKHYVYYVCWYKKGEGWSRLLEVYSSIRKNNLQIEVVRASKKSKCWWESVRNEKKIGKELGFRVKDYWRYLWRHLLARWNHRQQAFIDKNGC